ncbi:MAG TPA: cyclic 2,3-diphosphoglycerate synthase [Candidatus Eisenbacteria bacterium]|nr:cyclic 2,3-diphosphoglycerate synthase [Candidatus Eisenbacteria bacterium]
MRRLVILGAAGRDFHTFNERYRDDPSVAVVAFTAAQIPGIAGRRYPASLAGPRYPDGIPIEAEDDLEEVCRRTGATEVVFAYSDVSHVDVMHRASRALAAGADFVLPSPTGAMIEAPLPVVAISAVRTGAGKSPIARWLGRRLRAQGRRVAILRHPMPYGDLERQRVQRFATRADLAAARCTIEEREEYEPHLAAGNVVFAGVDYRAIVQAAAADCDVIVWDGGNNDFPFLRPDVHVVVVDALRPGQALAYHPGEAVLRAADIVVVSKVDAATPADVAAVMAEVRGVNSRAPIVRGASPVRLDDPAAVRGRRVLVVEDGPTITHGGMPHGAGLVAARDAGAAEIVDPRSAAAEPIREVYARHPHIGPVLPAMGYGPAQLAALAETIDGARADVVVSGTPIDLAALLALTTPVVRARYEFADVDQPGLGALLDARLPRVGRRDGA